MKSSACRARIKNNKFWDTLMLITLSLINRINNVRGDLADVSAKTKTLVNISKESCMLSWKQSHIVPYLSATVTWRHDVVASSNNRTVYLPNAL